MLAALATRFLIHQYNGAPLPPTAQLHDRGYHASNTLTTISIPRDSMMIELTDKVQKRWGSALVGQRAGTHGNHRRWAWERHIFSE